MKSYHVKVIIGILMLLALIPLNIFYQGGLCLNCLFSFFIIIIGLAILITGIVQSVRDLKDSKDGIKDESENVDSSSFIEPLFWTRDAAVRIFRNRRRSSAMLSGIILSTLIISSVFIFTGVMQEEIYQDFVKSIPYETSFKIRDQGNEADLWNFVDEIEDDKRVESATVFTGNAPLFDLNNDNWEEAIQIMLLTIPGGPNSTIEDEEDEDFNALPIFVRQSFTETTIYDKIFGDGIDGNFDLDPLENRTVIPRTHANRLNLEIGDRIEVINISVERISRDVAVEVVSIQLTDVLVTGIYSDERDEASEFFIFNTEILERNEPDFVSVLEEEKMFYLAVKIDPSEFDVSNMNKMNSQIDRLISDITKLSDGTLKGDNFVGTIVGFLNLIRYFIIFLDFIMILPTVILSIYFLIFGLDLSLEERKREVAILKVQGANSKQIFQMVSMEAGILFVVGVTVGYILSIISAWVISSSIGFMKFDFSLSYLQEFIQFHQTAFLSSSITIGIIVIISIFVKARKFIDMQVSEGVQRIKERKKNFFRRFQIDLILFFFGIITVTRTVLRLVFDIDSIMGVKLSLGEVWDFLLFGFLGTIAIWVGGSMAGPVISQWISLKAEKLFLKMSLLKDVSLIIKSGLKRRGDTRKLVLIIVLTLSVATLASVQGFTDQRFSERNIEYEIGADYKVIFSTHADHTGSLERIDGVNEAMPIPSESVEILSRERPIHGIDSENASFMKWHHDSFKDMDHKEALKKLQKNQDKNGIFLGEDLAEELGYGKGDRIKLKIWKPFVIPGEQEFSELEVLVLGVYDHIPSHIGRSSILCDHSLILKIRNIKNELPGIDILNDLGIDLSDFGNLSQYAYLVERYLNPRSPDLNATVYLVDSRAGADRSDIRKELDRMNEVATYMDLEKEMNEISDQLNFGIPGLLTMMFVASIIAVFTSAFAFSSIIIKRRMREFAVLQTVGATRLQIYKIAIGENALVMFVSVIFGLLVGLGLSYQMNGFFSFMGDIFTRGSLDRVVFLPWPLILGISGAIFLGMLVAVAFSAISAARQDLAVSTRVV